MENKDLDVVALRAHINRIFDHLESDLGVKSVSVDEDYYWAQPLQSMFAVDRDPEKAVVGSLYEDMQFLNLEQGGTSEPTSLELIHVAPLLTYLATHVNGKS